MSRYPKSLGGSGPELDKEAHERKANSLDSTFSQVILSDYGYEDVDLSLVPEMSRVGWLATGKRNAAGYTVMPGLALAFVISMLYVRSIWTLVDKWKENCDANMW